jgi:hypothetical protein
LQLEEFRRRGQQSSSTAVNRNSNSNSNNSENTVLNQENRRGGEEPEEHRVAEPNRVKEPTAAACRLVEDQRHEGDCVGVSNDGNGNGGMSEDRYEVERPTVSLSTQTSEEENGGSGGAEVRDLGMDEVGQDEYGLPRMAEYMVAPVLDGSAKEEVLEKKGDTSHDSNHALCPAGEQEEDGEKYMYDDPITTTIRSSGGGGEQEAVANVTGFSLDRQERFETLQQHIETLTVEKGELSMCLEQQTNIVRRLTEEHEAMVAKLNDAGRQQEDMQHRLDTYAAAEREMKEYTRRIQRELDEQERQNRLLQAKVTMLGKELVSMEDQIVLMNAEKKKTKESTSLDSHAAAEESARKMLQEELQEMARRLAESEKRRIEAEEAQRELQQEVDEARQNAASTKHEHNVALPQAAIVSAIAMDSYASEMDGTEMHILSPEIRALLPTPTWIPGDGHSSSLDDINSITERLYILLQRLQTKINNDQKTSLTMSPASASLGAEADAVHSSNGQSTIHHHHTVSISERI